ncbi:hypothetical protein BGZ54_002597, partial [Gamsiella multidivaricata]
MTTQTLFLRSSIASSPLWLLEASLVSRLAGPRQYQTCDLEITMQRTMDIKPAQTNITELMSRKSTKIQLCTPASISCSSVVLLRTTPLHHSLHPRHMMDHKTAFKQECWQDRSVVMAPMCPKPHITITDIKPILKRTYTLRTR